MIKAALYIRVSTEEQAKQGVSLSAQEEALRNYCKTYSYEVYQVYKDEGKSAKDIKHRPAMIQLLKDAELKKFDIILIYKLDRFSRSLKDLILTIEKLKKWGIDFISLQDRIETTSASGKLMFHIISSFAEFERDIIGERTKFGMEEKARRGAIINRAPVGYKINDKKLVIDEEGKAKVQEIFNYYLNNDISLTQLAKKYGFTVRGIKKLLKNKTYTGIIQYGKKSHKGLHEPIITEELFDKVQNKLSDNNKYKYSKNKVTSQS
ncbi:MAG: recombinase family protein [Candidatus Woesearchaeota archaeon]